jgi:hypothetical protein
MLPLHLADYDYAYRFYGFVCSFGKVAFGMAGAKHAG